MGPQPTIEEFQALAKKVVPFPLEIKNPVWVSRFFVQCRSASHYQDGRIFLVGDAAHIHSPAGGQGMNTGLQDAFNLAWKLALVIKGSALPDLLLSYEQERKPVGDYLIDRTDRFFKFMVKSSWWMRLLRRFLLPYIGRSATMRSRLLAIGSQTAIRYEKGVICTSTQHDDRQGMRIGKRIPNIKLITNQLEKTDLHTVACAGTFSCWLFLPKDVEKKSRKSMLQNMIALTKPLAKNLSTHLVFASDYDADIALNDHAYFVAVSPSAAFISAEPFYVLLRPDHHVFCLGPLNALAHGIENLRKFV